MDYEKAYNDALERARELKNKLEKNCSLATSTGIESIFPELAESEDERIRKEIINYIKRQKITPNHPIADKWIAWLEKQGETFTKKDVDDAYLKGICDAKRELEKQGEKQPADSYCQDNCKGFQETGKCFADGECKAKRDAENKPTQEIKSFEAEHGKYYYCIKDYFCGGRKQASKGDVVQALRGLPIMSLKDASEYFLPVNNVQNPAWSEEDEHRIKDTIYFLDTAKKYYASTVELNACINWLKSLKPQPQ